MGSREDSGTKWRRSLSTSEPLVQTAHSCCCTSFHYTHPGNVMVKDESAHNCPGYITHTL